MRVGVDQQSLVDRDDFVDAVGELVAAVFDMDLRTIVPNVAAVYISDAPHDPLAASRNRSEIFETNGEHLLDLLYDGLGREDDDPVVGANDAAAARDHHLAVAHDGADDRALDRKSTRLN